MAIFAFINDKKASNIDLAGKVWFGLDANISSNITQSTMKINSYSGSYKLFILAEGGIYHSHTHPLVPICECNPLSKYFLSKSGLSFSSRLSHFCLSLSCIMSQYDTKKVTTRSNIFFSEDCSDLTARSEC